MRDSRKIPFVSAAVGVVLLAGVVAFTVGLGELDDGAAEEPGGSGGSVGSGGSGASSDGVELPDELSAGLVAVDLGRLPAQLTQQFGDLTRLADQESSIADGLEDVFGAPGAFRIYASEEGPSLAQIAVVDKAPGLFLEALPLDPEVLGVTRPSAELTRVDDAVCSVNWGQEVPAGQEVDPEAAPQSVRCQLGVGERTYEITAQGLGVDETVAVVTDLAGRVAGQDQ